MDGYVLDGYAIVNMIPFSLDGYSRVDLSCSSSAAFDTLPTTIFIDGKSYTKYGFYSGNAVARYVRPLVVMYQSSDPGPPRVPRNKPRKKNTS